MFLWVQLQLDNLCRQADEYDIEEELDKLPPNLDATYLRILQQMNAQARPMRNLAIRALTWVFYADRPLSVEEFIEAIAIDSTVDPASWRRYSKESIIESCFQLLQLQHVHIYGYNDYEIVRPIHYSVKEFLTANPDTYDLSDAIRGKPLLDFFVHSQTGHSLLAEHMLCYFLHPMWSKGPVEFFSDLGRRVLDLPLSLYASRFFDSHLVYLSELSNSVRKGLEALLQSVAAVFASVLQMRALNGDRDIVDTNTHYLKYDWEVNVSTFVWCTNLSNMPYFQNEGKKWLQIKPSKYSLTAAASFGTKDAISRLIEAGLDIDQKDGDGGFPLYSAALYGNLDVCHLLISKGADVNTQGGFFGTALQAASKGGHEPIVRILLGAGADVNAYIERTSTALEAACWEGYETIVRILLDAGAHVNVHDGHSSNALESACINGEESIVRMLLDAGADVNIKTISYSSVLQAACQGDQGSVVRLILDAGAKVDSFALYPPCEKGNESILRMLLDAGADVNIKSHDGATVLQSACAGGYERIVRILLDAGADVNAQGGYLVSALQAAKKYDYQNIVDLLLQAGAPDEPKYDGGLRIYRRVSQTRSLGSSESQSTETSEL